MSRGIRRALVSFGGAVVAAVVAVPPAAADPAGSAWLSTSTTVAGQRLPISVLHARWQSSSAPARDTLSFSGAVPIGADATLNAGWTSAPFWVAKRGVFARLDSQVDTNDQAALQLQRHIFMFRLREGRTWSRWASQAFVFGQQPIEVLFDGSVDYLTLSSFPKQLPRQQLQLQVQVTAAFYGQALISGSATTTLNPVTTRVRR